MIWTLELDLYSGFPQVEFTLRKKLFFLFVKLKEDWKEENCTYSELIFFKSALRKNVYFVWFVALTVSECNSTVVNAIHSFL